MKTFTNLHPIALAIVVLTPLLSARVGHSAEPIKVDGTFVHSFSRFSFPTNVGAFYRVSPTKYDTEGKNVSVGYNLRMPPMTVTVYVYPAPKNVAVLPQQRIQGITDSLISHHFTQVTNDLVRARPTAKVQLVKDETLSLKHGEKVRRGRHAVFSYEERFAGFVQPLQSEAYLFLLEPDTMFLIDDRFYVKVRSTFPAEIKAQAEAELTKFLNTFAWPTK